MMVLEVVFIAALAGFGAKIGWDIANDLRGIMDYAIQSALRRLFRPRG